MITYPRRPSRLTDFPLPFLKLCISLSAVLLLQQGCVPSSARRTETLRAHIRENLFSTEHLAFGADPRSVNAVRTLTNESDIPTLIFLLADSSKPVARVAQYVLVSYEEKAIPHLKKAVTDASPTSALAGETIEMIRKRTTKNLSH